MTGSTPSSGHIIIGTAGHIDHGKTMLVKALTGIDADTLAEEKRRGITIELGFVFLQASESEKQIVFIDVPGHEKLIKTMVAGACNIDAALLVVAADEGIGVQTREHLDILQLLGIPKGLVAMTKKDLVDNRRIASLTTEIQNFIQGTFLEGSPVIPVSAVTGEGMPELKAGLIEVSRQAAREDDSRLFRMPIDRVFTMRGFGTVIAGTILSGKVHIGDEIVIYPEGLKAKVRGIQVHHAKTEASSIGHRTALNLQGVDKDKLYRGQCAAQPGSLVGTVRLDGRLHLLKNAKKELRNRDRLRLHTGTAEIIGRLILLDRERLDPGDSGYVQFVLEFPTVAVRKDRFVVRSFSPVTTIGGGVILDACPDKHKRTDRTVATGLRKLEGRLSDVVEQMLIQSGLRPQTADEIWLRTGENKSSVDEALDDLLEKGCVWRIGSEKTARYIHDNGLNLLSKKIQDELTLFFKKAPHRSVMPSAELRSAMLRWTDSDAYTFALDTLIEKNILNVRDSDIGLVGHEILLEPHEQRTADAIAAVFQKAGIRSPLEEEVRQDFGIAPKVFAKIMQSLVDRQILVRLSDKVTYHRDAMDEICSVVTDYIKSHQSIKIADLRDTLQFSRKYAQAVLEYLDTAGVTRRVEDKHIMK